MASTQVSSESAKKDELREAGRRRLEEFRKKKGAKKSVATSQPRTSTSAAAEIQASVHAATAVDSAGPAYGLTDAVTTTSGSPGNTAIEHALTHNSGSEIVPLEHVAAFLKQVANENDCPDLGLQKGSIDVQKSNNPIAIFETDLRDRKHELAISLDRPDSLLDNNNYNFPSIFYGDDKNTSSLIFPNSNVSTENVVPRVSSEGRVTNLLHLHDESESVHPYTDSQASALELGHNQHGPIIKNYSTSYTDESRPNNSVGRLLNFNSQLASEPRSKGLNCESSGPVCGIVSPAESFVRKYRPSFLDSLNIGRDSHASGQSFAETEKLTTSKLSRHDFAASFSYKNPATPAPVELFPTDNLGNGFMGHKMLENSIESKLEFNSLRQNDDFAALEQHIEDLTQEKFSLQRAMEASKVLAESLAAENSSLTESYNNQASIVSQLKAEMEGLEKEIKARLVELEAVKAEFSNVHLECNAADERAKLLASEVINLEEKALRLRSNELKLERELENSNAEIASYKKKLSSLENDRHDLQHTIDALQEEKKLLQSKIRKASTSEMSEDLNRGQAKKDASTSTNDMRNNFEQASSDIERHDNTDNMLSLLQSRSAAFEDVAMIVPPDQVQVIQNINSLISEIKLEKEEVIHALINELSTTAKLKDMNKELSHKLEVQTQRLELLTAQSMASGNLPSRQPTRTLLETVTYADEGDEVVERVLGWIMKLFPGGPSKRRTSRL